MALSISSGKGAVRFLGATCIVLTAFNARPLFSSVGSVLPAMAASLGLSGGQVSALTALPIICMGLFAPAGARIGSRLGIERSLLLGIMLLSIALVLRSAGALSLVFGGTVLAGLGIAIVNVLLPVLVKRRFADCAAFLTSLYTTGICAGAASGAALTLPLARILGAGWRGALLCWLVPALLALLSLAALVAVDSKRDLAPPERPQGLWRNPVALRMTLFFSLHSGLSYTVFGWLAPILTARGMDATIAGLVVALAIVGQMAGTMIAPHLAARLADQRYLNAGLALGSSVLLASLFFCPLWVAKWVAPAQGLFQGSLLAVSMMLVVVRSGDPEIAAGVSSMVQSAGMVGAGTTPFLVGLLLSGTSQNGAAAGLIVAIGAAAAALGYAAGLPGIVLGDRHRRCAGPGDFG